MELKKANTLADKALFEILSPLGFVRVSHCWCKRVVPGGEHRIVLSLRAKSKETVEASCNIAVRIEAIQKLVEEPDIEPPGAATAFVAHWRLGGSDFNGPAILESAIDCEKLVFDIAKCVQSSGAAWFSAHETVAGIREARRRPDKVTSIPQLEHVDAAIIALNDGPQAAVAFLQEKIAVVPANPPGRRIDLQRMIRRIEAIS